MHETANRMLEIIKSMKKKKNEVRIKDVFDCFNDSDSYLKRALNLLKKNGDIYDNKAIGYTISAGIAEFDGTKDSTKEDIIEKADKALYFGKNKGRNMVTKYDQSTPDIEEFRKTY